MKSVNDILREHIRFCFYEPYELLEMMGHIASKDQIELLAQSFVIEPDPEYTDMHSYAETHLSPFVARELAFFCRKDIYSRGLDFAFFQFLQRHPELDQVPAYIAALEKEPISHLLYWMAQAVYFDQWKKFHEGIPADVLFEDDQALRERVLNMTASDEQLYPKLIECILHPAETKSRYCALLQSFYEQIFVPQKPLIMKRYQEAEKCYLAMFMENPVQFAEEMMIADPQVIRKPTLVHISFVAQVMANSYLPDDPGMCNWFYIGVNNLKYLSKRTLRDDDRKTVERLCKALGDERRLTMLELIGQRPWYGQELAEHLALTPAAINYHLNFFYGLQILHTERKEHRTYVSLDHERLASLLDLAKNLLTGR